MSESTRVNIYMRKGERGDLLRIIRELGINQSRLLRLIINNFEKFRPIILELLQEANHERSSGSRRA